MQFYIEKCLPSLSVMEVMSSSLPCTYMYTNRIGCYTLIFLNRLLDDGIEMKIRMYDDFHSFNTIIHYDSAFARFYQEGHRAGYFIPGRDRVTIRIPKFQIEFNEWLLVRDKK